MKKNILLSSFLITLMSITVYAGGKGVVPAVTPVTPVSVVDPSPFYVGVGLIRGNYYKDTDTCEYEDTTYGGLIRVGHDFDQYFGVEARVLGTFWEADPLGGQKLQHFGIFAKPMYPIDEDINIYALLGYGWTKTTTGGNGNLPTIDENGLSLGIGLEYDLSSKEDDIVEDMEYDRDFDGQGDQEIGWGLFVDYQRLIVDSDMPDIDIISVGITYDF